MADKQLASPRILASGWGRMVVEGLGSGRDFKLWPGGGRLWDWREHGTGHLCGIQDAELEELLANGCRILILTRGRLGRLKVGKTLRSRVEAQGLQVVVATTGEGIRRYNQLAASGEAVGGLFHSTC